MPAIVVSPKGFSAALRRQMRTHTQAFRAAALEAAHRGVLRAVQLTDHFELVDTGMYKRSWKARRLPNGAELRNDAPYAGEIEYGRRPGRPGPPLAPILKWVSRKLVKNGKIAGGRGKKARTLSAAAAIRNHLHRYGTRPHFVLRAVARDLPAYWLEAAREVLKKRRSA